LQKFRITLLKLSPTLTTRERTVLQLVLQGASSSDIGARLKISLTAVRSHLAKFVEKLDFPRYDFVHRAVKRRVTPKGSRKAPRKITD